MILLSGWLPGSMVTAIVGGYLAAAFLLQLLESFLNWPEWVLRLSIFYNYQHPHPITAGWQWGNMGIMTAIGLACFLIGLWRFRQIDIQRG
jgi:putative exporter of polyketide antibiotics